MCVFAYTHHKFESFGYVVRRVRVCLSGVSVFMLGVGGGVDIQQKECIGTYNAYICTHSRYVSGWWNVMSSCLCSHFHDWWCVV